jgi:hypothetical protein
LGIPVALCAGKSHRYVLYIVSLVNMEILWMWNSCQYHLKGKLVLYICIHDVCTTPIILHDIIHKGLSENSVPPKSTVQPVFSLFNYAILCSIFRQPTYIIKYHMGAKKELPKTAWFKKWNIVKSI